MAKFEGMIFAAGLGTRLAPLTDSRPKALVEVCGKPLLRYAIDNYVRCGAVRIVVNVHHFAGQVKAYVESVKREYPDVEFAVSDESDMLLETGGGLKNAEGLFSGKYPIVVGNADVLCNIDLDRCIEAMAEKDDALLVVQQSRKSTRQLVFKDGLLYGWVNTEKQQWKGGAEGENLIERLDEYSHSAYNGFCVIRKSFMAEMPAADKPYGIIDAFLQLRSVKKLREFQFDNEKNYWFDVGTTEKLSKATDYMKNLY